MKDKIVNFAYDVKDYGIADYISALLTHEDCEHCLYFRYMTVIAATCITTAALFNIWIAIIPAFVFAFYFDKVVYTYDRIYESCGYCEAMMLVAAIFGSTGVVLGNNILIGALVTTLWLVAISLFAQYANSQLK